MSYDLYDGSTLRFLGLQNFRTVRLFSTYLNKFSPVNLRPFLNIKKRWYPHTIACITEAYFNRPVSFIPEKEIIELSDWLIEQSLIDRYGYHCWNGLGIPIAMRGGGVETMVPGLIGTSSVANSLIARYENYKEPKIANILRSVRSQILSDHFSVYKNLSFFKYKPVTPNWLFTVNASAIAASLICKICYLLDDEIGLQEVKKSVETIISVQQEDGSWYYSIDLKNNFQKEQFDFHQAYVIETLLKIEKLDLFELELTKSIKNGLSFQNQVQIENNGQVYYRYPKKFPANIHNQLYAYYVNILASLHLGIQSSPKTYRILDWTMNHLYNKKSGFIYGLYPFMKIETSYSRWGNAHFLLLFSEILNNKSFNFNE